MKKTFGAGLCAIALGVSACAADEPSESPEPAERTDELSSTDTTSCDLMRCKEGFVCVERAGQAFCTPGSKRVCETDSDCKLVDSYCGGCNCLALGQGQSAPKCPGDEVACLVAPCRGMQAFCEDGRCVAESGATF